MQFGKTASIGGLIAFGTTTSLFAKIVYELQSIGSNGETKYFHKPWAMTTIMFIGMSFCLPLAYLEESKKKQHKPNVEEPLLGDMVPPAKRNELRENLMLAIPTFFDLVATILMNVGLLYVTASVYQMMRGAEMLFAAFFAVTFLKRHLNKYHLLGLLCCLCGITLVGSSSLLSGEGSSTQVISQEQMLMGMALIIISQAVQAAQITFEDFFMADMDIAPMKIVGFEGVFGMIGTLLIMAPITYYLGGVEGEGIHENIIDTWVSGEGIHENIIDTWVMIRNSSKLQTILVVDMFALLMYNLAGMMVTGHLGAVFRTVLETMRTLFVWLVDLYLYYNGWGLGESWTPYSWLQAAGFMVLVCGTLVYKQGDAMDSQKEMDEALAVQATEEPLLSEGSVHGPGSAWPLPGSTQAIPHTKPVPTEHIDVASSFRASQTIMSSSYSRHSQRVPQGSPPARYHAVGGGGEGADAQTGRRHVVQHGQVDSDAE
ncbi:hypothetical protein CEUSTIGMA_g9969.t1 [Chlamydomonas eustigma]|uniref:EamA domain-containing protein n=1 Tax=Chlamydomonas eustigma TaxID=1157962 RepID=A0A250XI00_9CHLO|nr:hypothetical protein CEUSTIGMA_g9969.t1 [Chlamydomonas eustigma]|eukprot:GAX82542.1 hypothetical protein CEUSTIGMA_g9969.t1 [Chlamydomonas eustigma]